MANDVNITIVGAGVVGLAIASHLSSTHENIYVLEQHRHFGQETSSRNSEVIHSGIYYPKDSMKARFCVRGKEMLYDLCPRVGIPFRQSGKLIVATSEEEIPELDKLNEKANNNGVYDLEFLNQDEIKELEPNIFGLRAIFSPSTGIIDSHALMKYFENQGIEHGVNMAYRSTVKSISQIEGGYRIGIQDEGGNAFSFTTTMLINCAGLESYNISQMVGIADEEYKIHFCKGEYFTVDPPKNRLVGRPVYPVPMKKLVGLGVHATVDMGDGLKLGPNAIYLSENIYDHTVDASHKMDFLNSAKKFMPFLELEDLSVDMAGLRPKIQAPGQSVKDFIIRHEKDRGFPLFINLIGIESPGLTSAMAIAEYVEKLISDTTN